MSSEDGGQISYTVKELVTRLDVKVDAILAALNSKVDIASFLALQSKVTELESHGSRTAQLTESDVKGFGARLVRLENGETPLLATHFREVETMDARLRAVERGEIAHQARLSFVQKLWITAIGVLSVVTPVVVAIINHK